MSYEYFLPRKITLRETRAKFLSGIQQLATPVKLTMGPSGENVALEQNAPWGPVITRDGVTVARNVVLEDPEENMAVHFMKTASEETNRKAGDGTTASIVLGEAIYTGAYNLLVGDHNSSEIKKGVDYAVDLVVDAIKEIAVPVGVGENAVKTLRDVAFISTNRDATLTGFLETAMKEVGADGAIKIEGVNAHKGYVAFDEGMQIPRGFASPHFITDKDFALCELKNCRILIVQAEIESGIQMNSILSKLVDLNTQAGVDYPLLIVAHDVKGPALQLMVQNHVSSQTAIRCCAVRWPYNGNMVNVEYNDLSMLTGAVIVEASEVKSYGNLEEKHFGFAGKIISDLNKTTIDPADEDGEFDERKEQWLAILRKELDNPQAGEYEKQQIKDRLGRLDKGVATIFIGASSDQERNEKRMRLDDALCAVRSAKAEGIVPGGGMALLRARTIAKNKYLEKYLEPDNKYSDDFCRGVEIVFKALEAPFRTILGNAKISADVALEFVEDIDRCPHDFGYNALEKRYGHMFEMGIIDPAKVVREALQNGASAAGLLFTCACVMTTVDKPEPPERRRM